MENVEIEKTFRKKLAEYFWSKFEDIRLVNKTFKTNANVPERLVQALPAALSKAKMLEKLQECLLDLNFFYASQHRSFDVDRKESMREYQGHGMQTYKYAIYLKSTTKNFEEVVKKILNNFEIRILEDACRRYSTFRNVEEEKQRSLMEILLHFIDFIDEAIGMPGIVTDLNLLGVRILTGLIAIKRSQKNEDQKIRDEIYLSEVYNRLGVCYRYQNQFGRAIKYLNKALALKKTYRDRRDIVFDIEGRIASNINTIGNAYKYQGFIDKAIPYFEQAVEVHRKNQSENQWSSLNGLALCYFFKNDFPRAEELHRQVVDHFERTTVTSTDNTIACYICNLANAVRRNGKLEEARSLYQKAWGIQSKLLGDAHESTGITLLCLGNLELTVGDFQQAANFFERAYKAFRASVGLVCYETALAAENTAISYSKLGDFKKGTPWFHHGGSLLEKQGMLHMTMPWMNRLYLKYHEEQGNEEDCQIVHFKIYFRFMCHFPYDEYFVFQIRERMKRAGIA